MTTRIPADQDPDAILVASPLGFDWDAEGAEEVIRPVLENLARICDRIAERRRQEEPEPRAADAA